MCPYILDEWGQTCESQLEILFRHGVPLFAIHKLDTTWDQSGVFRSDQVLQVGIELEIVTASDYCKVYIMNILSNQRCQFEVKVYLLTSTIVVVAADSALATIRSVPGSNFFILSLSFT